jgi:hypothetical protein
MKLRGAALVLGAVLFAVFVWPTPYRADRIGSSIRKTNRVTWALGLDHAREREDNESTAAIFGAGVLIGLLPGYLVAAAVYSRRLRRTGPPRSDEK